MVLGYQQDAVRQRFTGYENDAETGLEYAKARYYSNKHGRFTSVDPIKMKKDRMLDPQRINLYAYVRNNPLLYIDPNGEDLQLRAKNRKEAQKNFDIYKKGFDPKDRTHITLLTGNGKNGYKAGEYAIQIDKKATGQDDNFKAAQQMANSANPSRLNVVSPKENFNVLVVGPDTSGKLALDKTPTPMNLDAKLGAFGYTTAPAPGATSGPLQAGYYSTSNVTEIYVASNQKAIEISATMHHEVTAHGAAFDTAIANKSAYPSGHSDSYNVNNIPKNKVDQDSIDAENRARKNFVKP